MNGFKPKKSNFPGVDIDAAHMKPKAEITVDEQNQSVTYPTAGVWLESGFYRLDELKQFIDNLEHLNKRNKELLK